MRAKVKVPLPETALARVLDSLERELIDATDEEIFAAAAGLGMRPEMKGSAAFMGLTSAFRPQLSDFFDLVALHKQVESERVVEDVPPSPSREK